MFYRSLSRVVVIISLLLLLLISSLFYGFFRSERAAAVELAEQNVRALVEIHSAFLQRALSDYARELLLLRQQVLAEGEDEVRLRHLLLERKAATPELMDLLILDREGRVRVWSGEGVAPDVTGRAYYRAHLESREDTLQLSPPLESIVHTGRYFFSLSRPIRSVEGELEGVVVFILALDVLEKILSEWGIAEPLAILLATTEGEVLFRLPRLPNDTGMLLPTLAERKVTAGEVQIAHIHSPFDGRERIAALRRLGEYPLLVGAAYDKQALLVGEAQRRRSLLGFYLLLLLLVGVTTAALLFFIAGRAAAQQRADALLERLQRIAEQVPGVVFQFRRWPDGRTAVPYSSPGIMRIYGVAADAVQEEATPVFRAIHPDDLPDFLASIEQSAQQLSQWQSQHRVVSPQGERCWVEGHATPEAQQDGSVVWYGYIHNITERKQIEQAMEALTGALAGLSGEAFYGAVSRYLYEVLGVDYAFVGRLQEGGERVVEVINGWSSEGRMEPFTYALEGTPCSEVMEHHRVCYPQDVATLFPEDHLLQQMEISAYLGNSLLDKSQNPIGILVALGRQPLRRVELANRLLSLFVESVASEMERLAARQQTQQQIRFHQIVADGSAALTSAVQPQEFDHAVEVLLQGLGELFASDRSYIFTFSSDLREMSNSHEWCADGVPCCREEIQGVPIVERPWFQARMRQILHIPEVAALPPEAEVERREFQHQGIQSILLLPLISAQGTLTGLLGFDVVRGRYSWSDEQIMMLRIAADVIGNTMARLRIERELAELLTRLQHSNAELEQFAYAASHDLRQPLRMVSSYLQLLERQLEAQLTEDTRQMMHFAIDGAKRMDQMLLSLLEYSRVGRKGEPMEPLSLRAAVEEALRFLQPAVKESAAEVQVVGEWPILAVSRDECTRLFQNLIGNALKYRVADRAVAIEIGAQAVAEGWRFWVADNGIGIDPKQFNRLFQVFQRLQTCSNYPGTGVGLAVARKIVERHGGEIWVESAGEGAGSRFCFRLPGELLRG